MSETAENWVKVAERGAVAPGVVVGVQVGELDIAVYNIDGQFYATHNACTHAHALLSDGWLEGDIIECPASRRTLRGQDRQGRRRADHLRPANIPGARSG